MLAVFYIVAGYSLGGWVQGDRRTPHASEGISVFVFSNGYHASLILPMRAAGADWSERFPASDFASPNTAASHVMFGWGERDFYMNTRTLSDLEPGVGLRAVLGFGGAVMHVTLIGEPSPGPMLRPLLLSPERYRNLVAFIDASFARDGQARIVLHPGMGYGPHDAFYEGTGRYTLFHTCNEWVGRALRAAGVPTGLWTPFASSLLREP